MAKMFVCRIGHLEYAISEADAVELLSIASRAVLVKQDSWSGPYFVQPEQAPFVDNLSLHDVEIREAELKPDKYGAATKECDLY